MQPKLKLLKILDILRQTSPTSPITAPAICAKLDEMGIKAERKSVCRDINTLIEYGYNIIRCHDNKLGFYMDGNREEEVKARPVTLDALRITIEYKKEDSKTVKEFLGKVKETEDDGYISAEVILSSSELFPTLLALGSVAKITSPTELKEEFEQKLESTLEFYRKRRESGKMDFWLL